MPPTRRDGLARQGQVKADGGLMRHVMHRIYHSAGTQNTCKGVPKATREHHQTKEQSIHKQPKSLSKNHQKSTPQHPRAPTMRSKSAQERPRAPKSAPRVLHEGPKSVQDRPKSCPRAPKGIQKGYKKLPNRTKIDAQTPKKSMLKTTYF